MNELSPEERMLEKALARRREKSAESTQASLRMKTLVSNQSRKIADGESGLNPRVYEPEENENTSSSSDGQVTTVGISKSSEDDDGEEEDDEEEVYVSCEEKNVVDDDEEDADIKTMPIDNDGLPCLVRMKSMRSLDEDDPSSESDNEKHDKENEDKLLKRVCSKNAIEVPRNYSEDNCAARPMEFDNDKGSAQAPKYESGQMHASTSEASELPPLDLSNMNQNKNSPIPSVTDSAEDDDSVLNSVQVRKYFGGKARQSFGNKVSWLSHQQAMHNLSPKLIPLASLSPNSFSTASPEKSRKQVKVKNRRQRKRISRKPRKISPLQDVISGRLRSDSDSSLNSVSSLDSGHCSLKSGISQSSDTRSQLVFDDQEDNDADIYVNRSGYQKGACLDIENLLDFLASEKGNKQKKSSATILSAMHKVENRTIDFISKIRAQTPDVSKMPTQGHGLSEVQSSPRSLYIAGCLSQRLNPRASHLIRKEITQDLHLEHFGMGDDMAIHLASSVKELPMLHYINIRDNNLTDKGMKALLASVVNMPKLQTLNMSDNVIGPETACALEAFLRGSLNKCPLRSLILENANVDDYEGAMFIKALGENGTLTELDLSRNLIGGAEILNSVKPDLVTAVESLAELIQKPDCVLNTISLAWNSIRLESSVCFAKALSFNHSIVHLDLSYNSLGHDGGMAIGEALLDNRTLRSLLLCNNNIGPTASFIICAAVEQNTCLRCINMDKNPIGECGAKAIMNLPAVVGSRLDISASDCNVSMRDPMCWFDESDPCGKYQLNMKKPYDRAVALRLMTICAHHHSYEFSNVSYTAENKTTSVRINLKQMLLRHKIKYLTKKEKKLLTMLYKAKDAARDFVQARKLFEQFDTDHSGEIDLSELAELLEEFDMHIKDEQLADAMAIIDVDGSGAVELPEFLGFLRDHQSDCIARIKEMTELPVMVNAGRRNKNIKNNNIKKYVPPKSGTLTIEMKDSFKTKDHYQVMTSTDKNNVIKLANKIGSSPAQLIGYTFRTSKLRLAEAFDFYETMLYDIGNKAKVLSHILPHMIVPSEARILVSKATLDDPVEVNFIRAIMGNALKPIFGLPCGYFSLELSREMDQICLMKLLELDSSVNCLRQADDPFGQSLVGDTSQYRNWSCFRNCVQNGNAIKISPTLFNPMPKSGKLEFDFSGSFRPMPGQVAMSDSKLIKILINLALVNIEDKDDNLQRLQVMKSDMAEAMDGKGRMHFECNTKRANKIAMSSEKFMKNLLVRSSNFMESRKKEEIKHDFVTDRKKLMRRDSATNFDPFMQTNLSKDDTAGLTETQVEQESKGLRPIGGTRNVLMMKLKAKHRIQKILSGQGALHSAYLEHKEPDLGMIQEDSSEEEHSDEDQVEDGDGGGYFTDEDEREEKEMLVAAEKAAIEREERLAQRRKTRVLVEVESLAKEKESKGTEEHSREVMDAAKVKKKKPNKFISLPSIQVEKNGKLVTLPSVTVPRVKNEDDSDSSDDSSDDGDDHCIHNPQRRPVASGEMKNEKFRTAGHKILTAVKMGLYRRGAVTNELILDKRTLRATKNRRVMRELLNSTEVTMDAKGSRLVAQIIDMMGPYWLRAKHIALVLKHISPYAKSDRVFGSLRVDVAATLFSRIVDLHNMELILREFSPLEAGCFYSRVGWLNVFNPMKPEGSYELDMGRWEERMVAKILLSLAMREPGENILNGAFQWDRDTEKTPGWVITQPWLCDDTMQRKGLLSITYRSKSNSPSSSQGLLPDVCYRRALLTTVLIREEEIRSEDDWHVEPKTPGKSTVLSFKKHWIEYLYGDHDTESKITRTAVKA